VPDRRRTGLRPAEQRPVATLTRLTNGAQAPQRFALQGAAVVERGLLFRKARWLALQIVGLAIAFVPAVILGFAEHFGSISFKVSPASIPFENGVAYVLAVGGLMVFARAATLAWMLCMQRRHGPAGPQATPKTYLLANDPFGSPPILIAGSGVLLALIFGYLALGANAPNPAIPYADTDTIKRRANELRAEPMVAHDVPLQALYTRGFAFDVYHLSWEPQPGTAVYTPYEEWGFPLRCLRTPIDIGIPRPGVRRLFFSQEQRVGWVERSETHRSGRETPDGGFRNSAQPTLRACLIVRCCRSYAATLARAKARRPRDASPRNRQNSLGPWRTRQADLDDCRRSSDQRRAPRRIFIHE
jgi:hypothetical protein